MYAQQSSCIVPSFEVTFSRDRKSDIESYLDITCKLLSALNFVFFFCDTIYEVSKNLT